MMGYSSSFKYLYVFVYYMLALCECQRSEFRCSFLYSKHFTDCTNPQHSPHKACFLSWGLSLSHSTRQCRLAGQGAPAVFLSLSLWNWNSKHIPAHPTFLDGSWVQTSVLVLAQQAFSSQLPSLICSFLLLFFSNLFSTLQTHVQLC